MFCKVASEFFYKFVVVNILFAGAFLGLRQRLETLPHRTSSRADPDVCKFSPHGCHFGKARVTQVDPLVIKPASMSIISGSILKKVSNLFKNVQYFCLKMFKNIQHN